MASIAPIGWHVPTETEYTTLYTYLGSNYGGKLKSTDSDYWDTPNTGATNEVYFNALGYGLRSYIDGSFNGVGQIAVFITSTEYDPHCASRTLAYDSNDFSWTTTHKKNGSSIRLIKDDANLEGGTMTDIDGNIYPTVKIGDQVWMAENLRVTHYNDGSPITLIEDNADWINATTGAYCYYDNQENLVSENIFAPIGWHIPTMAEMQALVDYLDPLSGGKLKTVGTADWNDPNTGATDLSGYHAKGAGHREADGTFTSQRLSGEILTSEDYYGNGIRLLLGFNTAEGIIVAGSKNMGCSVRFIKDTSDWTYGETLTDIDGNKYDTVKINDQVWTTANAYVFHYNDGTDIPVLEDNTAWSNDTNGAMCLYGNVPEVPPIIPPYYIPQYLMMTDGTQVYRKGVRNRAFVIDAALTVIAFGGIEGTDWINLETVI